MANSITAVETFKIFVFKINYVYKITFSAIIIAGMPRGQPFVRVPGPGFHSGQQGYIQGMYGQQGIHPGQQMHPEQQQHFMVRNHMMTGGRGEGGYMMGQRVPMGQQMPGGHYQYHPNRFYQQQQGQPMPPYHHTQIGPDGIPISQGQISPGAMHTMYPGGMMRHSVGGSTSPMGYPSQSPHSLHNRQTPPGHTLSSPRSAGPSPHPAMSPHPGTSPRSAQSPSYGGPSPQSKYFEHISPLIQENDSLKFEGNQIEVKN